MRWLLLLTLPVTTHAQVPPEVPQRLRWAPSAMDAMGPLSCGSGTHRDSIAPRIDGWQLYERRYTGTLYTTHGDSTLATVERYVDGCQAGTWYTLDAREQVTELTDYAPDNTNKSYRYDAQGRLTEYCMLQTSRPAAFYRIFGGGGIGACWSYDTLGRVTHLLEARTAEEQTTIQYYANGQMAERRWHSRTDSRIEQWCPKGKRIGFSSAVADTTTGTIVRSGCLIEWSVADYSYYLVRMKNEHVSLRRIPGGRWRTYDPIEAKVIDEQLRLRSVTFDDPERPAELPCELPRR